MQGTLYVVATPIGNLKDITFNALEILKSVDYIAAEDTRVSINLLNHYNIKNKLIPYHKFNEKNQATKIVSMLQEGKNIALISDAGTPCISDPGSILVNEAVLNNINVTGISGPSALITALSISGFDTTTFSFYGFLSRENKKIEEELETIRKDCSKVVVIYESPKRIIKTLIKMKEFFINSKICICNDLTKKFEKIYRGTLEEVIKELESNEKSQLGEYVIVIEKEEFKEEKEAEISIEAKLIDTIIKEEISMKDAIESLAKKQKLNKKDVYNASLKIKEMFKI